MEENEKPIKIESAQDFIELYNKEYSDFSVLKKKNLNFGIFIEYSGLLHKINGFNKKFNEEFPSSVNAFSIQDNYLVLTEYDLVSFPEIIYEEKKRIDDSIKKVFDLTSSHREKIFNKYLDFYYGNLLEDIFHKKIDENYSAKMMESNIRK